MKALYATIVAATAMTAAIAASGAFAQTAPAGPSYVVTYIEVVPTAKAETATLLKQLAADSRKEAGNLRYDVLQRMDRDHQFAILESWTDLKATEAHASSAAFKQFRDKLKPLQSSFYDERPSTGIDVAATPPAAGKFAIYAITHVDVTPPNKDECIALLKKLAAETRKEPGAERFEAWQQNNRANHFTVTEIWKDIGAHDAHVATASTREFRDKLGPMSGALYDERLYTRLD